MPWPLVGRERELEAAGAWLADPSAGGAVVTGAAGVGKTRLAQELARRAADAGYAVEWVRATRSAATIPFGALAALVDAGQGGLEGLARVRRALAGRAAGRRLVLCVDDGHLLDHGSAALVHQLVAAREAAAVVTVGRDERAPDALRALWKDELCARVELGPLSRDELERLTGAALGGPLDGRSADALWALTRGNPLHLRELLSAGAQRGDLADDGGVWRWRGDLAPGPRLAELVGDRLDGLDPVELATLEVVAVGSPVERGLLAPEEDEALEALEAHDLVEPRADGRRRLVGLAHPIHGEAVRGRLTRLRLEAVQRRLADAVDARGRRRGADVARVAAWRLASGGGDGGLFEEAAEQALAALDPGRAERFARAAVQAGGDFGARLTLARALAGAGDPRQAERELETLEGRARGDGERAAVAVARARNLFWGLDRAGDADACLRRARAHVSDRPLRDELVAQRVRLAAAAGRPHEALAVALPLVEDPGAREPVRLQAAVAAVEALLSCGRTDGAVALADHWLPVARRLRGSLPIPEIVLLGERAMALRFAGRLEEATAASEATYALVVRRAGAPATAVEAASLGMIWLARGRVRTALRFCREGAALLRDLDVVGMRPWALAGVAQAAAQAGEPALARAAVQEMEASSLGHRHFEAELWLARAWSAAAAGELTRARGLAREAAGLARGRGQDTFAVRALHELCRLGDPGAAAPELAELAGRVDGAFARVAAAHAAAALDRDGPGLLRAAEAFAAQGALLAAAEAADAAGTAFREAGRAASARSAGARARAWLDACEGARPPALLGGPGAEELTPREREVALLAAGGLTSAEIAARLVVSVRTVDNHLQRAYRKLGVTRRHELAGVLGVGPPPASGRLRDA